MSKQSEEFHIPGRSHGTGSATPLKKPHIADADDDLQVEELPSKDHRTAAGKEQTPEIHPTADQTAHVFAAQNKANAAHQLQRLSRQHACVRELIAENTALKAQVAKVAKSK
jgi:hypothetical protein